MRLKEAADRLKQLELKMSEVYLWCSINFEDLEIRQFFSDMSDQELAHARRLDEIRTSPYAADIAIGITDEMIQDERKRLDSIVSFVKTGPGLDETMLKIVDMESGELNLIFESICQSPLVGQKLVNAVCINTKFHINLLKKAAEQFPLRDDTKRKIYGLQVRDKNYYKVFSD